MIYATHRTCLKNLSMAVFFSVVSGLAGMQSCQAQSSSQSAPQSSSKGSTDVADFPDHRVRLIIPTSPGAGTDFAARLFAQLAAETWKQAVVPDNRSGASGMIGLDALAKSEPDGYTLGWMSVSQFVDATLQEKFAFDAKKDFTPISVLASTPLILVANPSAHVSNLKEMVALLKSQPGQLTYSSGGTGGITHLAMEFFLQKAGVKMLHVPYKGSGPAVADLLAGHVQFSFSTPPAVMGYIKAGQLKAIGLASDEPSPLAPGVPTFAQQGLPGVSLATWYGLFGPHDMDPALVQKISMTLTNAARGDAFKTKMAQGGLDPILSTPAQFTSYLADERARWTQVAKDIGFKHD
jgi:tripartite-type tricarboxylate transporter receptor subunit TctC